MSERSKDDILDDINKIEWDIHDTYGQSYLTYENQILYDSLISEGRALGVFSIEEVSYFKTIFNNGVRHLRELKEHLRNQPRRDAQAFIGKKNIREWVFNRDGCCLRCGSKENLSVDHIEAINRGGQNRLSNIQTLCRSCNSWKSDKFIDLR